MQLNRLFFLLSALCAAASAQDRIAVPVGPSGPEAMRFELEASGVLRTAGGILYQGTAWLVTPLGPIVLGSADLRFAYAPGTGQVESVSGRALVPTPLRSGSLPVSIDDPVMAELGYALGENLKDLGVPLEPQRAYLFFKFDAGLTIRYGKEAPEDLEAEPEPSFSISFPAGVMARIIVDPLDPMFYFSGAVTTPKRPPAGGPGKPDGKDRREDEDGVVSGSGTSRQGLFPFEPLVTWGIEDQARPFRGQRILTGTFPLYNLPLVTVRGHLITNLDPMATGELAIDPFGIGLGPAAQAGANGRFAYSLDFLNLGGLGNFANITIPLGKATAAVEIVGDRQLAYVSGVVENPPDLGLGLLLAGDGQFRAAGLVSTDLAACRLRMEGHFKVGMPEIAKFAGFDLGNILHADGTLSAGAGGFHLAALTEAGVNLGPLTSRGQVRLEMSLPSSRPENSFVELEGGLELAGLGLRGKGRASADGLAVTGILDAPEARAEIRGEVRRAATGAVSVAGTMTVPAALQPDVQDAVRQAAREVQQELDRTLAALRDATRGYEFELSLRGMRVVIPPAAEAAVAEMDRQIVSNINARWPRWSTPFGSVEAPGKSEAIRFANRQAQPYRDRLRELQRLTRSSDNETVRAGLERELLFWIGNPRLRITYTVAVVNATFVVYDAPLLSAGHRAHLQVALAGVRALPDASDVKVKAEQAWDLLPKRELLLAAGKAVENGVASGVPVVESIGFRFPLGQLAWDYQAVLTLQGRRYPVVVQIRPANIGNLAVEIGKAFAKVL